MSESRRDYWESRGVEYDDQAPRDNEALPAPPPARTETRRRGRQWLREMGGPDHFDAQWARGARGWLSLRDPVTNERVEVPTKYADPRDLPPGTEPAPQWLVRRAMEKLPPKPQQPVKPAPRPAPRRPLPPVPDDGGPL